MAKTKISDLQKTLVKPDTIIYEKPPEPVKDELWALECWLNNILQESHRLRTLLKAFREEEVLVRNIIKKWRKIK